MTALDTPPTPTLLTDIRTFIQSEVIPLEARLLRGGFRALLPTLQELRREVTGRGWAVPFLPPAWGGMGLSLREFAHVSEVLGQSPLGHYLFNCQAPDVGNMELVMAHGTTEQQEAYLRPLAAGQIRSCFAMTEPEHAGSNPVYMSTTAVRDGDDYVIDGHKWFTSAADGAAFAIVMAVTNPDAPAHARASQIIVPTDTPGFSRVRNISIMGEAGEDYMSHAEVRFDNCRVPQSNRIGAEGAGFALAQERLGPGRIHHCMRWIGIASRALNMMTEYAARRELAPGKPLASRQVIQHWLAESQASLYASRLMVLDTVDKIEREGMKAARMEISMIKFYVANVLQTILDRAIQVHGALGMTDDTILAFWYRHERAARIYDGPDEVHKSVVARLMVKPYGVEIE